MTIGGLADGSASGTVTSDTTAPRTGSRAYKCDSTGANSLAAVNPVGGAPSNGVFAIAANRQYFFRAYIRFEALPDSTVQVLQLGNPNGFSARLTSGGKLQLFENTGGTQIGSDSAATITTGQYYRIEISCTANGAATGTNAQELRLDGVTVASGSSTGGAGVNNVSAGWVEAPGASKVCYVDDVAGNDSQGATSQNTWPGDGSVVLMLPISDNARGNWTAGAGGTTSLFDAVNNTPPVGVADSSATNTSQIKIKSTSIPSSCDLNLDTYTNAGVTGTVNSLRVFWSDGEDPATGTKAGTAGLASNPAVTSASFNYGNDGGAQGTYVGLWTPHQVFADDPTVTLGTAPVIRITCTSGSTGTRAASCCFLGLYVDYTPPAAVGVVAPGIHALQAVNRAGVF